MPAVDIDREPAYEAAQRELAKAVYPRASLSDRLAEWLNDLLHRLMHTGAALPGGWFTIVVLGMLLLAAAVVAARIARRTMGRRGVEQLYGSGTLSAADHRARANDSAARGDWAAAIRQRLRAIARQLEEDGVLNLVPGRTADELAHHAGLALPTFADDLAAAAAAFDDVTYGDRPGTERNYQLIADLDDRVQRGRLSRTPGHPVAGATT